jgi:hypothetical protein
MSPNRNELVADVIKHAVIEVNEGRLCGGALHTAIAALNDFDAEAVSYAANVAKRVSEAPAPSEYAKSKSIAPASK